MDTRFWGPSGWQLFHLVAYAHPANSEMFFNNIKNILPCKFCRASTAEFMEEGVPLHPHASNTTRWVYELHSRVNKKLREQSKTDKTIAAPPPDPTLDEVSARYHTFLKYSPERLKVIPGADFMFALGYNYPEKPTSEQIGFHYQFWNELLDLMPYTHLREGYRSFVAKHPIQTALQSRSAYMHWVHKLLKRLCRGKTRTYRGMCQHVGYFKSACNTPTYRGKTCRKTKDGYRKTRDNNRTFRLSHGRLID